jgi:hypothetical protein
MSDHQPLLPPAFAELEPLAPAWGGLASTEARYLQRQASSMDELRRFYDLVAPRIEEMLDYVDRQPYDVPLSEPDERLYRIALSLIEVAEAVEIFRQPTVPHTEHPHRVNMLWTSEA